MNGFAKKDERIYIYIFFLFNIGVIQSVFKSNLLNGSFTDDGIVEAVCG